MGTYELAAGEVSSRADLQQFAQQGGTIRQPTYRVQNGTEQTSLAFQVAVEQVRPSSIQRMLSYCMLKCCSKQVAFVTFCVVVVKSSPGQ